VSVALIIQHEKRTRRVIWSSVACLTVPHSFTLSHKRHDFGKEILNAKRVFLSLSTLLSETFFILRSTERDVIINVY